MPFSYLILRLIRHFLPDKLTRFLLLRGWLIKPGMETRMPFEALQRYKAALSAAGYDLTGKRVLVLGYGGRFAIGCALLKAGASHVVLCEYKVHPDDGFNHTLLPGYADYLEEQNGQILPRAQYITLVEGDIRQVAAEGTIPAVDIVLSNSVFEHVADVEGIASALAQLTRSGGGQVHFIDLRDHFFRHPFEMLCHSATIWKRWLNPTSNLNRFRLKDYRTTFERHYSRVEIEISGRDEPAFNKIRTRILPEFLTGDVLEDAVTNIRVVMRKD